MSFLSRIFPGLASPQAKIARATEWIRQRWTGRWQSLLRQVEAHP